MLKPAEEGRIWEWRAFGRVSETLARTIQAYPIRLGISDVRGDDIYLISPRSDQNIKLRRYAGGWVLKIKLLLETKPGSLELYNESTAFTYPFPVSLDRLKHAAQLLDSSLPTTALWGDSFTEEEFVKALEESSPSIAETRVTKKRSQYQFEDGWLELADVNFATRSIQSVSIHSSDIDVVREMIERLKPGGELESMNYIEACRRWGLNG
jgi:hypothetical protein